MRLEIAIKAAHRRTRQTYGAERMQRGLAEDGIIAGICRIKRIKRKSWVPRSVDLIVSLYLA